MNRREGAVAETGEHTTLDAIEAEEWRDAGFQAEETAAWVAVKDLRLFPDEAAKWRVAGFTPELTARCFASGWDFLDGDSAEEWRTAGFTPEDIATFAEAGWGTHQVEDARDWGHRSFTAEKAAEWRRSGWEAFEADCADQWCSGGFTPGEAGAWLKVGWGTFEGEAACEWRRAGVDPVEARRLDEEGHAPSEVGEFTVTGREVQVGLACRSCGVVPASGSRFCPACGTRLDEPKPENPLAVLGTRFRKAIIDVRSAIPAVPEPWRGRLEKDLDRANEWRPGHRLPEAFQRSGEDACEVEEELARSRSVEAAYVAQAVASLLAAAMAGAFTSDALVDGIRSRANQHLGEAGTLIDCAYGCLGVVRVLWDGTTTSLSGRAIEARCRTYKVQTGEALEFAQQLADNLGIRRPRRLHKVEGPLAAPLLAWISGGQEPAPRTPDAKRLWS